MRSRALLTLLNRPLTILFVPVVALALLGSHSTGAGVPASSIACALLGVVVGGGISEAARCSFAWTLPRFRRDVLVGFVACGGIVSATVGLIVTISGTWATTSTLIASVSGFAAFSLAGALCLGPEPRLLLLAVLFALVAARAPVSEALLREPLVAGALAALASGFGLWYAFAGRAFRWYALAGPRQKGPFFEHPSRPLSWWPTLKRRRTVADSQRASRASYVGTSVVRAAVSSYRATTPTSWLGGLALGLVCLLVADLSGFSVSGFPQSFLPFALLVAAGLCGFWSRGLERRSTLPWSRRRHLAVAFVRDATGLAAFLLVVGPLLAVAGAVGAVGVVGTMGREIAMMLVVLPAVQWTIGPPTGGQWPNQGRVLFLQPLPVLLLLFVFPPVVNGLPTLVRSGAGQAAVLGLLVVWSQALNWKALEHYFANRDLIGGEP